MALPPDDYKKFIISYQKILHFSAKRNKIISARMSFEKFLLSDFQTKAQARMHLVESNNLVDEYEYENRENLTNYDISLINNFKRRIYGEFLLFKCIKDYGIFYEYCSKNFYQVHPINDPFDKFAHNLPANVKTTIFPYKNKLITDGMIELPKKKFTDNFIKEVSELYMLTRIDNKIIKNYEGLMESKN